jgi:hypothetical protein
VTAPRSAMAAVALELIEFHGGDWDSPANFVSVRWDGDKATLGGYWTAIALDVHPDRHPAVMRESLARELAAETRLPYGLAYQQEAHTVRVATEKERALADSQLRARNLDKRPDAREACLAWVADAHGRVWLAEKYRDDGSVREAFWPPLKPVGAAGAFLRSLALETLR